MYSYIKSVILYILEAIQLASSVNGNYIKGGAIVLKFAIGYRV